MHAYSMRVFIIHIEFGFSGNENADQFWEAFILWNNNSIHTLFASQLQAVKNHININLFHTHFLVRYVNLPACGFLEPFVLRTIEETNMT